MSDILLDTQSPAATPAAGQMTIYADSSSKKLSTINDAGLISSLTPFTNFSVASQTPFATDTYITGSSIALLSAFPRIGTLYHCSFDAAKTNAGTAAPVLLFRYGTLGTTGDATILTFTFPAQTAAVDTATFNVFVLFRVVGGSAVVQGRANLIHKGTATGLTGFSIEPGPTVQVTSGAFVSTVANSIAGLSINGGLNAVWTMQMVFAQMMNL